MDAAAINENQKKLVDLKGKFIALGVVKMPVREIEANMPDIPASEVSNWCKTAKAVWHFRSTEFEIYLPIFRKVYEKLQEKKQQTA